MILDVNVRNEWVFPVAHALERSHIPFLFLTAYSKDVIPAEHREKPLLAKPYTADRLLETLVGVLSPDQETIRLATRDGQQV